MTNPLVECIPNYSDARRPEVVSAILASIQAVKGVQILDRHSDLDHNRTVVTMIGSPAAIEEAAFQSIKKAAELINLDEHTGAHPRIGATDVVPFVPISDISMAECIEMARRLGKRVGEELDVPVYLYEEAATRPERQNLESIRKGQYEGLKEDVLYNPERKPDFGPARLGTAGATVIGARHPLIAFNVYLTTNDISIAQKIAKAVRNSSGGLRFVKAMGVMVDGRAQVSMNLTNFRQTPIARVVEMVRREAERYGVGVQHSELVGLVPQEALVDAAVWYTQLDQFEPAQILESRLFGDAADENSEAAPSSADFLDELASASPAPGGGSAAAHTAAAAAALVTMVCRLTVGKKKYATVEAQIWPLIEQSEALRSRLNALVAEDAASFTAFMTATKLPKDNEEQMAVREAAIEKATLEAARVPYETVQHAAKLMELALIAAEIGNLNAISDAASAFQLAKAALQSAGLNILVNVKNLQNPAPAAEWVNGLRAFQKAAREQENKLHEILKSRAEIDME
ncbi:MAG: glutamate formimidoyltransferase [Anaerolineaceae bacterium]|nr:glutamate formimidoyltransferase [Anaerolineaceae bacterium]